MKISKAAVRIRGASLDRMYRDCEVERSGSSDKTVQVLFSSESPVERKAKKREEEMGIAKRGEKYLEVLSHDAGDADFSELNRNAPVLDEHDGKEQVGNVKRARLSKDKVGRALLGFDGDSELSDTRYKQVKRGNRQISTGYSHTKFLGDITLSDGRVAKKIAWKAHEISTVANGADARAGANRSTENTESGVCLGCGEEFDKDELDANQECEDCRCEDMRKVISKLPEASGEKLIRGKDRISHSEVRAALHHALSKDSRFKHTDGSGNTNSNFYVHDIEQEGDSYRGIVVGPHYDLLGVEFDYDGSDAMVHEVYPVEFKGEYEPKDDGDGRSASRAVYYRSDAKKPYGDVEYADPGYQKDKKKRYPINTKEHAKAAWSYINKEHNSSKYSAEELAHIKGKIKAACKKFGVEVNDEKRSEEVPTQRSGVDSQNLLNVDNLTDEQKMKLRSILLNPAPVEVGNTAASEEAKGNLRKLNEEITKRTDGFIKDHGKKQRGQMTETLRKVANEFLVRDHGDSSDREVLAEFGQRCLEEISKVVPTPYLLREAAGERNYRSYSFARAIRSAVLDAEKHKSQVGMPDGFEREIHDDMMKRAKEEFGSLGYSASGFQVPCDAPTPTINARRSRSGRIISTPMQRDLFTGDYGSGGALVPTEFVLPIIEPLYNRLALSLLGVKHMAGLQGNIVIPRMTGVAQPQAVGEIAALVATQEAFDQIELRPRRAGNTVPYSKQLLLQSAPDVEALIRDDNFRMIAIFIDEMGLNGTGANGQPLGIMNQPGIAMIQFGGQASLQQIIAMETAIRKSNINDPIAYLSTSNTRGVMRGEPAALRGSTIVSGQTNALWTGSDGEEEMNGRPAYDSQQVPLDQVICAAGEHIIHAMWGGLDVVVDYVTKAANAEIVLTINTWNDFAVRHPQAICISADAGSQ